ncbi:hypothetical protein RJ641_015077 [Dillenia turbinata]|uniref:Uncharacterized protein n=1 Tax=Dillenia turbinata TaxID=194707 RepID=A0AAN8UVE5_9MAGN
MGFLVTTLIFIVIGIIASMCTRICCNRGPSTNFGSGSGGYANAINVQNRQEDDLKWIAKLDIMSNHSLRNCMNESYLILFDFNWVEEEANEGGSFWQQEQL